MITSVIVGDRIIDSSNACAGDVWEVVQLSSYSDDVVVRCVDPGNTRYCLGNTMKTSIRYTGWKYIGNFNKSDNLVNLFDILNS